MARSRATASSTRRRPPARGRRDPVGKFQHDHGVLNQRVHDIAALVRQIDGAPAAARLRRAISKALADLREQLFLHFAREEEGLFPFASSGFPALSKTVASMVAAHDGLCGTLARLIHEVAVNRDGALGGIASIFSRFQRSYDQHARRERVLLEQMGAQIRPDQRDRLAAVVRGL